MAAYIAAALGTAGAAAAGRAMLHASRAAKANQTPEQAAEAAKGAWKWGRKYFEGGFDKDLSRSEAAKVLGVRESACKEQIMDQYRNLMRFNHPDLGGSPMVSAKISESKDMLAKRARSDPQYVIKKRRKDQREQQRAERKEAREARESGGAKEF